jgi:hypothetical protein
VVTSQSPPPTPTQAQIVNQQNQRFDAARQTILAPVGATSYEVSHQAIEAQPQGNNATLDKVLLQFPGVTQDSAASGELHVRNEHANIQYRINGIMLPDGVGAFGQILDTGIIGSLALLTGALPAQYGLRTAGVLDIQTKTDAFNNTGSVSVYGGSHGTITPSFEYGGMVGQTQYFASGRFLQNNLGIENPTPSNEAIHDRTSQEKGFLYLSTVLDPTSRLTFMSGISNASFQIPNRPGQMPNFNVNGITNFDSSTLNEHQNEFNQFDVLAYQKSAEDIDHQISYFNRYSQLHFFPDPLGDLIFNGVSFGEAGRHQHRVEPIPVRSGRAKLYRYSLYLHRPRPGPDRVGRRFLSVERHALQRLDDLRQRASFRLRQHRSLALPAISESHVQSSSVF